MGIINTALSFMISSAAQTENKPSSQDIRKISSKIFDPLNPKTQLKKKNYFPQLIKIHFSIPAVIAATTFSLQAAALPNPGAVNTALEKRYVHGLCGVHVIQYQKNEGPGAESGGLGTSDYRFTVTLKDADQNVIGGDTLANAPGGQGVGLDSQLPFVFVTTTGSVDSSPIEFNYGAENWISSSGQCSVGGYDNGSRHMDCGFSTLVSQESLEKLPSA